MALLLNGLLLIAGLAFTVLGLSRLTGGSFSWLIVTLGAGMIGVAWHLDRLRVRRRNQAVANEIADRTATLTGHRWRSQERLEIPPNRWLFWFVLGMTLVGGWMVQWGVSVSDVKWPPLLAGTAFLGAGVLILPTLLASIGKPALVLDRNGLTTPVDGAIPWSAVEGIYLQVLEHNGRKSYSLMFRVPTYANVVSSIHWSQRWLSLFGLGALRRGQVGVALRQGKEQPATVEAVARHLWKSATGHEHFWNPNASAASNEAFRQLATMQSAMADPTDLARTIQENPAEAFAQMEKETERMEQVRHQLSVITAEQKKVSRSLNWVFALAIAGMLVTLGWLLLKRLLAG